MASMPYYQPNNGFNNNQYLGYQPNSYPQTNYGYMSFPQNNMVQQSPIISQQQTPQVPSLYGKIVDGIDTVRVQEIPIGNYGIYPKGDGSTIYVKSWNSDGSTKIDEYQKIQQETDTNQATSSDILKDKIDEIYSSIKDINKKIDDLKPSTPTTTATRSRKKEVDSDGE